MNITLFESQASDAWDQFVLKASNATFLHERQFLSYHGNRFEDKSLLIENSRNELVGVFPAAVAPQSSECIVSHPGATFGGIVSDGKLRGRACVEAITAIARYYCDQGYTRLLYKAVPHIYHQHPFQDDLYALFLLNARRTRCDLSASIDLVNRGRASEQRRRSLNKAKKAGVRVEFGIANLGCFWTVLQRNLEQKHGVAPVHTFEEMSFLANRFADSIEIVVGVMKSEVVAGIVLFDSLRVSHAQYIASNDIGYECSALDAVFDAAIRRAQEKGKRFFDFGISNEQEGRFLNEGLYQFKAGFGAGGVLHEFFELDLRYCDGA